MRKLEDIGKFDIINLPNEIIKELSLKNKLDEIEEKIVDVMKCDYEGFANIDEIIVGMYRKYNVIKTRDYYVGKLYKMAKDGKITSIPKRRGVFCLPGSFIMMED